MPRRGRKSEIAVSRQRSVFSLYGNHIQMRDFRRLKVWEKAPELGLSVYKATATFPQQELFGLTSQLRRALVSIPANIAEGCGRSGQPELARFLRIALGSASELEYHIILSTDLCYFNKSASQHLFNQSDRRETYADLAYSEADS
jgi:four helix bundle protein